MADTCPQRLQASVGQQSHMPEARRLRVCFVGCGNIAGYHLEAALATARVEITCLVDPSAASRARFKSKMEEAVREKFGHEMGDLSEFDTLEAALEADPEAKIFEACDIMVPSFVADGVDLHESTASLALRARRHVFIEKPIAVTPEAGARLLALHAEVAPDRVFAIAENARFVSEVLAAKACIESGCIGEVLSARAKYWDSAFGGPWAVDFQPGTWRCDKSKLPASSITYDASSHYIRPLRYWFGEVKQVVGITGRSLQHMPGTSYSQHVLLFESGKSAIYESMLAPMGISDQPFFTIQGTLGEIVIGGFGGGCHVHTLGGQSGKEKIVEELCNEGWASGYEGEYADFVEAVLDGRQVENSAKEALADLRVVCGLFEAAERGCWVPCK